jgi:predicted acylesterase/phospholipase RssA
MYEVAPFHNLQQMNAAVAASASQPIFMLPVDINNEQFVDGGVREYLAIQVAIDRGATEIYAISLSPKEPEIDPRPLDKLFDIALRTASILLEDIGSNDLVLPRVLEKGVEYIHSIKQLLVARFNLDSNQVEEVFASIPNPLDSLQPFKIHIIQPDKQLPGGFGGVEFRSSSDERNHGAWTDAQKFFGTNPIS